MIRELFGIPVPLEDGGHGDTLLDELEPAKEHYRKWDESQHPRDSDGKFTAGGDSGFHNTDGSTGGGLGIKRQDMPQVKGDDKPEFFDWLSQQNIGYQSKTMSAAALKPTQADLNTEKVGQMAEAIRAGTFSRGTPPLVSNDGYVLDGHHRWGAYREADPDHEFDVVEVDLPIRELLEFVRKFPKSTRVDADGNRTKYSMLDALRARLLYQQHDVRQAGRIC